MKANQLKATIDKMVADSIRRLLPEIMNEVLIRTLANGGIVSESRAPAARQAPQQAQRTAAAKRAQQLAGVDRSLSLREALSVDDSGADFYEQAERRMTRPPQRRPEPEPMYEQVEEEQFDDFVEEPAPNRLAQRISQLPPALQSLAEETFRSPIEDDGGEMWGDDEWAPFGNESTSPQASPLNIEHAARVAKVDFSRAQKLIKASEGKNRRDPQEVLEERQWELQRLQRKREELDRKA